MGQNIAKNEGSEQLKHRFQFKDIGKVHKRLGPIYFFLQKVMVK